MGAPAGRHPVPGEPETVAVDPPITLGQFVKLAGLAATGGEAKQLITGGLVRVNAEIETRRGHKLTPGDVVDARGTAAQVAVRPRGPAAAQGPRG